MVPKFNCVRLSHCITVAMNIPMARKLVELLQDFKPEELDQSEVAFLRQLESLSEDRRNGSSAD